MMEPYTFSFAIAPEKEIILAINRYLKSDNNLSANIPSKYRTLSSAGTTQTKAEPLRLASLHAKVEQLQKNKVLPAARKIDKEEGKFYSAHEFIGHLINAVAILGDVMFKNDPDRLVETRSIIRYCQLLAARLGMSHFSSEKLVLASWLFAFKDKPDIIKKFSQPFEIGKIIFADDINDVKKTPETIIFQLVTRYHELQRQDSSQSHDINAVRRNIKLHWGASSEYQHILETFLQILIDEEFIAALSQGNGKLLVVSQEEAAHPEILPLLVKDGYEATLAASIEDAIKLITSEKFDLIMLSFPASSADGMKFCRTIRNNPATKEIPFIAIIPQNHANTITDYYKEGADEVFIKPFNNELLFLKIHRLLTGKYKKEEKIGLTGSIEDISFTDMIQIFTASNKSVQITLKTSTSEGHVYLKEGKVIHAETESLKGQEAFYKIMQWRKGEFSTKHITEFPEKTISADTISLLMEGARLADEANDNASA